MDIIDVKKEKNISLATYDALVLGTSVYAGQPVADFKKVIMPSDDILSKPLFLFVCGMEPQESKQAVEINNAFPGYILDKAKGTYFVGGEFDLKKMNFFERMIIKKIAKTSQKVSDIKEENLSKLVEDIKKALH